MKTNIIKIGTSKGIRIPNVLIKEFNLKNTVELERFEEGLLIKSVDEPRAGWREMFEKNGDDSACFSEWDETELSSFDEGEW